MEQKSGFLIFLPHVPGQEQKQITEEVEQIKKELNQNNNRDFCINKQELELVKEAVFLYFGILYLDQCRFGMWNKMAELLFCSDRSVVNWTTKVTAQIQVA